MEILKSDKKFKEAIGAFVISFSELENSLARLAVFTIPDPRKHKNQLPMFISYTLDKKRSIISDYIKLNLPDLINDWNEINQKIGNLNRYRRFVVHGIISYSLPNDTVKSYIKDSGGKIVEHLLSINEIKSKTLEINKVISGNNGTGGEFREKFIIARLNNWNKLVKEKNRFDYKSNGEKLTD